MDYHARGQASDRLMSSMVWISPQTTTELAAILTSQECRLHGGGTGLLRNPPSTGTIVDLAACGIGGVDVGATSVAIGGTATFADVVSALASAESDHLLHAALWNATTPALRNRITVGGSVALFPPWSSVVGPLIATDATVTLVGAHAGEVPITDYLARRELHSRTAIVRVDARKHPDHRAWFYRFIRNRHNYPLFTVSGLVRADGDAVGDCRIVLTGNTGRYHVCEDLSARLVGRTAANVAVSAADIDAAIPGRQGFSSDYLTHCAATAIERGVVSVLGGTR